MCVSVRVCVRVVMKYVEYARDMSHFFMRALVMARRVPFGYCNTHCELFIVPAI